jgi:hypothetical protein
MTNFAQIPDAPDYLRLLKGGVQYRMARLWHRAHQTQSLPPSMVALTWREARQWGFDNWNTACGALEQGHNTKDAGTRYEKRVPIWYCHTGEQFRDERDAHEVDGGPKHRGWYCDEDGLEKCIGIVGRLPHGLFIAGYRLTDSGERVYFGNVCHSEDEAAIFADSEAWRYAENQREHGQRYSAVKELRGEIAAGEEGIKRLWALRNHPDLGPDARFELSVEVAVLRSLKNSLANNSEGIEE